METIETTTVETATVKKSAGRKPNTQKHRLILDLFQSSATRQDFVDSMVAMGHKQSSANVVWYGHCKATGRVVAEKRGPKAKPKAVDSRITAIVSLVEDCIAKKQSTVGCRRILELAKGGN